MAEGVGMAATDYTLLIGDKNYSSWSLRPWLALKHFGIPFAEECVRLRQPDSRAAILEHSPSGKVPALKTNSLVIWDSLAILEFLAERHSELGFWPKDGETRALARAVSAEMHAGFSALRNDMAMDLLTQFPCPPLSAGLEANIRRIVQIWRDVRIRFGAGGPFMFGAFSCADAMYAPVATRFRTYGVDMGAFGDDGTAADYTETIFAMAELAEWTSGAQWEMKERARTLT